MSSPAAILAIAAGEQREDPLVAAAGARGCVCQQGGAREADDALAARVAHVAVVRQRRPVQHKVAPPPRREHVPALCQPALLDAVPGRCG